MNYLSVCSGIEAASVAWEHLGWQAVAFSEIDAFPAAVLAHRFPTVPNWGDMTNYEEWLDESIDLICGGTPCQSFSIAGLRKGLDDERGNLMLTFGHILAKYRPRWFVWENVPGVLSSNGGRDFASFLGLVTGQAIEPPADGWRNTGCLSGIGSAYGIAYRVLDAQYTRSPKYPRAVPQRRRRVFVVGHLGDWRRAAAVLLDSESVSGHPPPSREAGQRVAPAVTSGPPFSRTGNERIEAEAMVVFDTTQITSPKNFSHPKPGNPSHPLTAGGDPPAVAIQGTIIGRGEKAGPQGSGASEDGAMFTLTKADQHAVAFQQNTRDEVRLMNGDGRIAGALSAELGMKQQNYIAAQTAVRRLLPVECERLQAFPDGWTDIPWRGKPDSPDGPRYKAIGNSMATNVMEWIGRRIQMLEARQ